MVTSKRPEKRKIQKRDWHPWIRNRSESVFTKRNSKSVEKRSRSERSKRNHVFSIFRLLKKSILQEKLRIRTSFKIQRRNSILLKARCWGIDLKKRNRKSIHGRPHSGRSKKSKKKSKKIEIFFSFFRRNPKTKTARQKVY